MYSHIVRLEPKNTNMPKKDQLAWKIAEMAMIDEKDIIIPTDVKARIKNHLLDVLGVSVQGINQPEVQGARKYASEWTLMPRLGGAPLIGAPNINVNPFVAAYAAGTAGRSLDWHDTYLGKEYAHPADVFAALVPAAQHFGVSGKDLIRGAAVAYQIHTSLVDSISLHKHGRDHPGHTIVAMVVGLATMLKTNLELSTEQTYQMINYVLTIAPHTRQLRTGVITGWKAETIGWHAEQALRALDHAMRVLEMPSPVYEGAKGFMRVGLDGEKNPDLTYMVNIAEPGDLFDGIMRCYTKQYAMEYMGQAPIDLAFKMQEEVEKRGGTKEIKSIVYHTSHHTDYVIGSAEQNPAKKDANAPRETLDHSVFHAFTHALLKGEFHHERAYETPLDSEQVRLMECMKTVEDAEWSQAYDAREKFGGRIVITFNDGSTLEDSLDVAKAHPNSPSYKDFSYQGKFLTTTSGLLDEQEQNRLMKFIDTLDAAPAGSLDALTPVVDMNKLQWPSGSSVMLRGASKFDFSR